MNESLKSMKKDLKKKLSKDRMEHTIGVMYTAASLAMANHIEIDKAMVAGLLHDCAKHLDGEELIRICKEHDIDMRPVEVSYPYLLHAKAGACLAKQNYQVDDPEILHAIAIHTTGQPEMSLLDKIIFVADYIEPNRQNAANLSMIRSLAFDNLDMAVYRILEDTLSYLKGKDAMIDAMTMDAYEYYKKELERQR